MTQEQTRRLRVNRAQLEAARKEMRQATGGAREAWAREVARLLKEQAEIVGEDG